MDIEDIKRIELRPGDKLVVRFNHRLTAEQADTIAGMVGKFAPGVPFIILDGGATIDTLSSGPDAVPGIVAELREYDSRHG